MIGRRQIRQIRHAALMWEYDLFDTTDQHEYQTEPTYRRNCPGAIPVDLRKA
jgi:hypothetical protein